jgi:hypothetical protein
MPCTQRSVSRPQASVPLTQHGTEVMDRAQTPHTVPAAVLIPAAWKTFRVLE